MYYSSSERRGLINIYLRASSSALYKELELNNISVNILQVYDYLFKAQYLYLYIDIYIFSGISGLKI